jgi:dual specificity tyrosine-phosphorylation-regulated kinase 2/3/4
MLGEPSTDVYEQATRAKLFFDAYGSPIIKENSRGKRHYPGTKSLASILNTSDFEFLDFVSQ